ncbi:hypothetical protein E1295_45435 [Nonomuraea mesophila]|uniref:Tyr recombinase domain-containing protein n=1 Tax=Nonomuraea mesophila TaxID=2530382 RepID=A0A4V2Z5K0_9ACTN|nr:tyrosine-type recombinase/integrase [Nonomuraea mesophila]TDE24060.1 hypothetical protein E1295_45435 [Nonomuraea mesophila]
MADEAIKRSPAKSPIVQVPKRATEEITAWSDERVRALIDAHPAPFRLLPMLRAACGLRQGELFALALEDIDFVECVLRVRRQIKKLGADHVFALPKNDRERVVPLPEWAAAAIKRHLSTYPPLACSLPWEKVDGTLRTYNLLFRWTDDRFIKARSYSEGKPALVAAGVIPTPNKDTRQRSRYVTSRKEGLHQLRHYYASVVLAGGVSVKELAEYLGHADPGFTLRKAVDDRLFHPRPASQESTRSRSEA